MPSITTNAQSKKMQKANDYYDAGEYYNAFDLYVKVYSKTKSREEKGRVAFKAGMCAKEMMNPQTTISWFRKAMLYKYQDPLLYLYLADAYMLKGVYDEAKENYANYKDLVPNDIRGRNGIKSCDLATEWMENPTRYEVEAVNQMNSMDDDFAPAFCGQDTNVLYFTSTRESSNGEDINANSGKRFTDIFMVQKDKKGTWTQPVPANGSLNSKFDDGSCSISPDGRVMLFTHCPVIEDVDAGCKIFTSEFSNNVWGAPQLLEISTEITQDTALSVGQPALSHDGLTLYFVMENSRGKGGTDIWFSTRKSKNGKWSNPKNMGSEINTEFDELYPTTDKDGNLYFSTSGRIGMGGLDIFKATKDKKGNWTVENMKYPINSNANDFGITFNPYNTSGYFSSSRKIRRGDDIYKFWQKPLDITLNGFVINDVNHAFLQDVDVKIIGNDGSKYNMKTNAQGAFTVKLSEEVDYMIITEKKTFLKATAGVSTKGVTETGKVFEKTLYMKPGVGNIKIRNIRYDFNDTTLREESKVALNELVEILELNSTVTIELRAHTDFRGSDKANLILSQGRANSVVAFLIENGISPKRLKAKGYGETAPTVVDGLTAKTYPFLKEGDVLNEKFITSLKDEEQQEVCHELNRRTEFKVLSTDYRDNHETFGGEQH